MSAEKPFSHSLLRAGRPTSAFIALILTGFIVSLIAIAVSLPSRVAADGKEKQVRQSADGSRLISESTGVVATHDGQRLKLVLDLGNVLIKTTNSGKIDYTVRLEVNSSEKDAQRLPEHEAGLAVTEHERAIGQG